MKTIDDVKAYIRQLAKDGLLYHWDDQITDVMWSKPVDIEKMQKAHDEIWSICNPWLLLESDKELSNLYEMY